MIDLSKILNMIPLIVKKESIKEYNNEKIFDKIKTLTINYYMKYNNNGEHILSIMTLINLLQDSENKVTQLEHQNKILQTQLDYEPDGPGYKESKEHFESLLEK